MMRLDKNTLQPVKDGEAAPSGAVISFDPNTQRVDRATAKIVPRGDVGKKSALQLLQERVDALERQVAELSESRRRN